MTVRPGEIPFPGIPPQDRQKDHHRIPRRQFLKLFALTGFGTAVGAYATHSGFREFVDQSVASIGQDLIKIDSEDIKTFSNNDTNGYITRSNILLITAETAIEQAQLADKTALLFPLGLPPEFQRSKYEFQKRATEYDPKNNRYNYTYNGNRQFIDDVPKGTKVYAPADGVIYSYENINGQTRGIGLTFDIEGIRYTVDISNRTSEFIFTLTKDMPTLPEYVKKGKTKKITRGEFFMVSTDDKQNIQISYTSTPISSSKNLETPVPIKWLTTTDDAGNEKLLVPNGN